MYETINCDVMMEEVTKNKIKHISFKNSQIPKLCTQTLAATAKKKSISCGQLHMY
jgi:hypothetical protein